LRFGNISFNQFKRSASTRDLNSTHCFYHSLSFAPDVSTSSAGRLLLLCVGC
jgi:hypothetical protein